jgi:amino acid adenylation domain-containing protein
MDQQEDRPAHERDRDQLRQPIGKSAGAPVAASLSPARQQLLALRLHERRQRLASVHAISRRPDTGEAIASHSQGALWFLDRLLGGTSLYNSTQAVRLDGALDASALERSLQHVVERHASLRTQFEKRGAILLQRVQPAVSIHLPVIGINGSTSEQREQALQWLLRDFVAQPFDLSRAPLVRAQLLRTAEHEHVLQLVVHHIVSDGWSMTVMARELSALYSAFVNGVASPLGPLPIQFTDYALWQCEQLQGVALEGHLRYWREQLRGLEPLELPTDRPRPAQFSSRGSVERFIVTSEMLEQLKALARRHNATLFMVLLAAFKVLLMRYTGQVDVAVGSPVAGRERPELEGLIGYFVNSVVLRTDLSGNPGFEDLLGRVRDTALQAYEHQELPFDLLVAELSPHRDLSRNPLYQVSFALNNQPAAVYDLHELQARLLPPQTGTTKFDLSLSITEMNGVLQGEIEYSIDLFDSGTIERLSSHFRKLLAGIVEEPSRPLSALPLLSEAERHRILVEWNETTTPYPQDQCLHQLFEAQVIRSPDAMAAALGDRQLSYLELNARANRVAHHLRCLGIGPDIPVGLYLERSLPMLVAMLGVLKAGGAYVPLDRQYPAERLAGMLRDCAAPVVLTQQSLVGQLPKTAPTRVVCLDTDWPAIARASEHDLPCINTPEHLAAVIYTSGSTGTPKGVQIPHRGVCNHLHWITNTLRITSSDRFLQKTPISFDASIVEIFAPLQVGGMVVLAEADGERDTSYLAEAIQSKGISILQMVPSAFRALLLEPAVQRCSGLRQLICGGEALDRELAREFQRQLPDVTLGNFYGPTEASIDATWHQVKTVADGPGTVPIGRPVANVRCHVLDGHLQPVPVGVVGQLYIGGAGLARGYLNRPELTRECFIADPFRPGHRLYATGDLVRYLPDGALEYHGRLNQQVKIRGYRIELGEIEANLATHPEVARCVVISREDRPGDTRLVAYIMPTARMPAAQALREHLGETLPEFMVPQHFVQVDVIPLLRNGKLDRNALPVPEAQSTREYEPPRGIVERTLAALWQELLGVERIGRRDHFFELGGDSLMVMTLIERMRQHDLVTDVRTIFANLTLSSLGAAVTGSQPGAPALEQRSGSGRTDEAKTRVKEGGFRRLMRALGISSPG